MKKVLIMCDSFKGTLTSLEVNNTIKEELDKLNYKTKTIPISDGGEGFLDAMEASIKNTKRMYLDTVDTLGRNITAPYLYCKQSKTAYFSLGDTVGLSMITDDERDCFNASTYGLGLLIKKVINKHIVKNVILGIGGSASTDAGTGLLEAMGVKFYDQDGSLITKMSNNKLSLVKCVITCEFDELIKDISFKTLSDVVNPLYGKNGAAYVYGPQKGASSDDVVIMNENLISFANLSKDILGIDASINPGSGAAGGVGYAMMQYFNSELVSGIDYLLESINFSNLVKKYDLVISGEGKIDDQSFNGKVISGILKYNLKEFNLVVGINKSNITIYPIYSIVPELATSKESLANPKYYLQELIKKYY